MEPERVKIRTQPVGDYWSFENSWDTGLFDCRDELGTCMKTDNAENISCITALRTKIRTGFRIRGTVCGDACATCWCPCCVLLQISNELEHQHV
ncbi:unnamed protein product [Rotaria magnacalcarata]|uniref:Uncharacterized protein n=1 Tax=Rotaria magnacalcarata TaxID=392030 RepID=A0A814JKY5_9BILA|nr:unnamed protein product [Rotaria magnacalcarata]CAF4119175.1 unnamed protein product [Rotaria magnacalcarata]CAF4155883.1 unnamed protein product [Rotaria magnacalcarata]CAF5036147.1 unnamed protein product [Rotaria magnacalcarata]CAF5044675.1 unnamed protein product [Rotaria magnacalcarata]